MTRQTMLKTAKFTVRMMLGTWLGATMLSAIAPLPANAQVARPTPLEDLQTKDGSDFFNGRGNGQTGSVMNFIQNAIIGTPRSMDEFSSEQQENFDAAASQFRKRQAEQLRKQQSQPGDALQVAPLPTPASN
ncbi:MAG: hypothetical protein NW220_15980 [Leptolyngbyaceae cyanobacterium bins.349]|nr:hypothetical protein [Leptolyngbyaceae cyanobacterium bins.349]